MTYNPEKLKQMIEDFHNVTGMAVSLLDRDFQGLFPTNHGNENAFCNLIQSTEEGLRRCRESDCRLFAECARTHTPVAHQCHAGLTDAIVPIYNNEMLIGYILFGRVVEKNAAQKPSFANTYGKIRDLGLDRLELKKAYESLEFFDSEKVESASEIVTMLTKYILWEHLIRAESGDAVIDRITDYIHHHLTDELTVADLCRTFHVSKNTLYQQFDRTFGCGVKEYITARRIENVKQLLRTTSLPVWEICERSGVRDPRYFSKFFKRATGITPSQYRKSEV